MPQIGERIDYRLGWDGFEFRFHIDKHFIDVEIPFLATSFYIGPSAKKDQQPANNHPGRHPDQDEGTNVGSGSVPPGEPTGT